jgi:predicted phage replisome organizer
MSDVKWIKIRTNIFEDEKIMLIEGLPKADSILIIWFKLLCLAGKTNNDGIFMLNEKIPYTSEMLSKIFRRKKSLVDEAIKTFQKFGMIEIVDGVTTIPKWNEHQSLQGFDKKKEYMREYMKEYRSKQNVKLTKANSKANVSSIEREEEKEVKNISPYNPPKGKPTYYPNDEKLDQAFSDYVAMRKFIKKPMSNRAVELAIEKLNKLSGGDNDLAIEILNQSTSNSWQGLFPLKNYEQKTATTDWSRV